MLEEFRREHAMTHVLPEPPVTLPLRFIEELIERRLLRKIRMSAVVVTDVFRLVTHERGLHVHEPGSRRVHVVSVAVNHARQRRVRL